MAETLADLVLYLEHGVRFARHRDVMARSSLGATLSEVPGAVRVVDVVVGELADEAGVQSGDFLLQLGGASVFDLTDVAFFLREHGEGEETEMVFAHDGDVRRGSGRLAPVESKLFATAR
jgi:S1-C subfamily serine protease